ncbi:MAG: MBL fold metallo-hydrolase [Planctomycetota bacterium]
MMSAQSVPYLHDIVRSSGKPIESLHLLAYPSRLRACFVALVLLLSVSCCALDCHGDERSPFAVVLGIAQDAGYPQANCQKACCAPAWKSPERRRFSSCLGLVDPVTGQRWMFDCTPDFREQLRLLDSAFVRSAGKPLNGIFPTHAHIGHYAGLIHLGREVIEAKEIPVMAMPRMKYFLETNGPWDQMVKLNQIRIVRLQAASVLRLNDRITVTPFLVPHRDEYSETVGFLVSGPDKKLLYLPDIDKWERWDTKIEDLISQVDIAFLDGTFFSADELPGRNMDEIPHPFMAESISRFTNLTAEARKKIKFIHLNHTNPALDPASDSCEQILRSGLGLASQYSTSNTSDDDSRFEL